MKKQHPPTPAEQQKVLQIVEQKHGYRTLEAYADGSAQVSKRAGLSICLTWTQLVKLSQSEPTPKKGGKKP